MNDLRTAAQQALEALEAALSDDQPYIERCKQTITALRAALAEPVQEPVAWMHVPYPGSGLRQMVSLIQNREPSLYAATVPLYVAPPQRKPLTDDEIAQVMYRADAIFTGPMQFRFAREIERAHGIT